MHTIKLLLTYYLNISVQAANYQIAESNRIEKIYSVARIESNRTFLPELECSTIQLVWRVCCCGSGGQLTTVPSVFQIQNLSCTRFFRRVED